MNGSRRAATRGGRIALSTAMTTAAPSAARSVESDAPGTSFTATNSETAASNHESTMGPSR